MADFLEILSTILDFMRNNGVPFSIGDFSATISFLNIAIGVIVADMGIYWLFRLFDGD